MSVSRKPGHRPTRERYPHIEERIGEDPARFLDHRLLESGPGHTDESLQSLFYARVRGIDELGVINAWIIVEKKLVRGPRGAVMKILEERRDELLEIGDRDDRLQDTGEREPTPSKEVVYLDEDGEPRREGESASAKIADLQEAEA